MVLLAFSLLVRAKTTSINAKEARLLELNFPFDSTGSAILCLVSCSGLQKKNCYFKLTKCIYAFGSMAAAFLPLKFCNRLLLSWSSSPCLPRSSQVKATSFFLSPYLWSLTHIWGFAWWSGKKHQLYELKHSVPPSSLALSYIQLPFHSPPPNLPPSAWSSHRPITITSMLNNSVNFAKLQVQTQRSAAGQIYKFDLKYSVTYPIFLSSFGVSITPCWSGMGATLVMGIKGFLNVIN